LDALAVTDSYRQYHQPAGGIMQMSEATSRTVGRIAWYAAWVGTVLAPIHALARFATEDGKEDLESGAVRAWAEPAAKVLQPLLDWSDPQTVYVTYGKLWVFIIGVATVAAFAVRQHRGAVRGAEKWGWRIALPAAVLATVSTLGDYWTPWLDASFLFLGIPAVLLSLVGNTTLGIGLLRRGYRPRATSWLLALFLPLFMVLTSLIAMGAAIMPMVWAWGISGRALSRADRLDGFGTASAPAPDASALA
jgi:hypothetical protein